MGTKPSNIRQTASTLISSSKNVFLDVFPRVTERSYYFKISSKSPVADCPVRSKTLPDVRCQPFAAATESVDDLSGNAIKGLKKMSVIFAKFGLYSMTRLGRMSLAVAIAVGSSQIGFAGPIRAVTGFKSTGTTGQETTGDRSFKETGFVGTSFKFTTDNISQFTDGTLKYTDDNVNYQYGWTDVIPSDLGSGNKYPQNPERGDTATPFANEPTGGTLKEVFGSGNLAYLLDGESNVKWSIDLFYKPGTGIVADGDDSTIDLLMLERGANSMLGVRAILADNSLSNDLILNFRTSGSDYGVAANGGLTDFKLNTTEIDGDQSVAGIGVDLSAFGLAKGSKVIGFQYFVNKDTDSLHFDGPDFLGFVATQQPHNIVPEPSSFVLAGVGGLCLAFRVLRRRPVTAV